MIRQIEDDFDLEKIAGSGQCFRWRQVGENAYRIPHRAFCLTIRSLGGAVFEMDCNEEQFERVWRGYFDLDTDYRAIRGRIDPGEDPFLYRAAQNETGIRILRQDPWETLVSFIISQNRNIPAIRRSVESLCEAAGEEMRDGYGNRWYAFPPPKAVAGLDESVLTACRLGYRCSYVKRAAQAVASGAVDLDGLLSVDLESAMERLTALYGVGNKVASCVALFGLHRLDAFPVDVWMHRILENEYPRGYPMERYRPFNGVYQQYMFAWYRSAARRAGEPG